MARGAPFTCRGGILFGANRVVGDEDAIKHAVALAKESDGMHFLDRFFTLLDILYRSYYRGDRPEP